MNDSEFERVCVFKHLGMQLDECLTLNQHADYMHQKATQRVAVI